MVLRECSVCQIQGQMGLAVPFPSTFNKTSDPIPTEIVFCANCGVGLANPEVPEPFLTQYYRNEKSPWGDLSQIKGPVDFPVHFVCGLSRWKQIESYLDRLSPEKLQDSIRILDIGAGNGAFGIAVARSHIGTHKIKQYIAQDLDTLVLSSIKNYWPLDSNIELKTINHLSELNEKVDVLILSHVIEHVQPTHKFLNDVLAVLNPGGIVLAEVPNKDYKFKKDLFPHVRFFDKRSFSYLFKNAGIQSLECEVWGSPVSRSPFGRNKISLLMERALLKFKSKLPERVYFKAFDLIYGASKKSSEGEDEGPWLRYVGIKG